MSAEAKDDISRTFATIGLVFFLAFTTYVLASTLEEIRDRLDAERIVLCRIEAALHERPPSTPKPEECK